MSGSDRQIQMVYNGCKLNNEHIHANYITTITFDIIPSDARL